MTRRRVGTLATAVVLSAAACVNENSVTTAAPGRGAPVQLGLRAQVYASAADRVVVIRVAYRRVSGEQVALGVSPSEISLPANTSQVQEVTVDVEACLTDPQRVGAAGGGCQFVVTVELEDASRTPLSRDTKEVSAPAAGVRVDAPIFTLVQPGIRLSATRASFGPVEEKSTAAPSPQVFQITSVSGVPLPELTATVDYPNAATAPWLSTQAVQGPPGEGSATVSLQPTGPLNLAPSHYAATVWVKSSLAGVQPQAISVTYDVTEIPSYPVTVAAAGAGSGMVTSAGGEISCTITDGGGGQGSCNSLFKRGTVVTLTATPLQPDNDFESWSGSCGTARSCQMTVPAAPTTITASFRPIRRKLIVALAGTGTGTVETDDGSINCGNVGGTSNACSASMPINRVVTLKASPASGSTFAGWAGDLPLSCGASATCQVTMDVSRNVSARFDRPPVPLTVGGEGTGEGVVESSDRHFVCTIKSGGASGACTGPVAVGTTVTLSAKANEGSEFAGWRDDAASCGTSVTCPIVMNGPRNVTAGFRPVPRQLTVELAGSGTGMVTSNVGIICGTACSATVPNNTVVNLVAAATGGSTFRSWGDDAASCGVFATCQITMDRSRNAIATFILPDTVLVYSNAFSKAPGAEWSLPRYTTSPSGESFLGELGNDTTILQLGSLPTHTKVEVEFDVYVIRSWDGNRTNLDAWNWALGPDVFRFGQAGLTPLVETTFANYPDPNNTQSYPSLSLGAANPRQTGASRTNSLGYVYIAGPINGNDPLSNTVMDAVYHIKVPFDHSGSTLRLSFSASGLQYAENNNYFLPNGDPYPTDESWGIDNVVVRTIR